MIRPLRQSHRAMVVVLAATLPTAFAIGLATRKEVPASGGTLRLSPEALPQKELWSRDDLWEKPGLQTRLLGSISGTPQLAVELRSRDRIARPDVLVYWVPGEPKTQDTFPDNAFLLGSFDGEHPMALILPAVAAKGRGFLTLYSLAEHNLVAISRGFSALDHQSSTVR